MTLWGYLKTQNQSGGNSSSRFRRHIDNTPVTITCKLTTYSASTICKHQTWSRCIGCSIGTPCFSIPDGCNRSTINPPCICQSATAEKHSNRISQQMLQYSKMWNIFCSNNPQMRRHCEFGTRWKGDTVISWILGSGNFLLIFLCTLK